MKKLVFMAAIMCAAVAAQAMSMSWSVSTSGLIDDDEYKRASSGDVTIYYRKGSSGSYQSLTTTTMSDGGFSTTVDWTSGSYSTHSPYEAYYYLSEEGGDKFTSKVMSVSPTKVSGSGQSQVFTISFNFSNDGGTWVHPTPTPEPTSGLLLLLGSALLALKRKSK